MKSILITTCITQESDNAEAMFGEKDIVESAFDFKFQNLIDDCGITADDMQKVHEQEHEDFSCKSYLAEDDACSFGLIFFKEVLPNQVIILDLDYLTEVLTFETEVPHVTLTYLISQYLPVAAYLHGESLEDTEDYFYVTTENLETGTKYLILKVK